jgi:hypothetical protein
MMETGKSLFDSTPKAYIAPYSGGASESFDKFIGEPCLVTTVSSPSWVQSWKANDLGLHELNGVPEIGVPLVLLTHRRGNCFQFIVVDPNDPSLSCALQMWKERGCYLGQTCSEGFSNLTTYSLTQEGIEKIERFERVTRGPDPKAFEGYVESLLSGRVLEAIAAQWLWFSGAPADVMPIVEVNILTSEAMPDSLSSKETMRFRAPSSPRDKDPEIEPDKAFTATSNEERPLDPLDMRCLEFGHIVSAKSWAPYSKSAAAMNPKTPVLVTNIDFERFTRHSRIEGVFGFGCFNVDDRVILSMRLQSGSVQIYWLADATDPEVWHAIKRWKTTGEVGFVVGDGRNTAFLPWKLQPGKMQIEQFESEVRKKKSTEFIDAVSRLVASGVVHMGATTDIPHIPLEYVHVNVLMTRRLEQQMQNNFAQLGPIALPQSSVKSPSPKFDVSRGSTLH